MQIIKRLLTTIKFFVHNIPATIKKPQTHHSFYPPCKAEIKNTPANKNHNPFEMRLLLLILVASSAASGLIRIKAAKGSEIQSGIASEIIRFHVIANSDSDKDQHLKLLVKDGLVTVLSPYLKDVRSVKEARSILTKKLSFIQKTAEHILSQNGCSFPVKVSLMPCSFPIKVYGSYTFPAGIYEALRVQIGRAGGKNWWCVMFPPLCFVDETYSVVDEKSEKQLKYLLTEEEFRSLKSNKPPVKVKFKLWNSIKKLISPT